MRDQEEEMDVARRKRTEELLKVLGHYLPGGREDVRKEAVELFREVMRQKALNYLQRKYNLQGKKDLAVWIEDMESLPRVWEEEELERNLEFKSKSQEKRAKAKNGKDKELRKASSEGDAQGAPEEVKGD